MDPDLSENISFVVEEPVVSFVEEPVVSFSTVEEPVVSFVEEPVVSFVEEPVVSFSTVEEPVVSIVEEPVVSFVEEPVVSFSTVEEPVVSIVEEPVVSFVEEPVVSIVEEPVSFVEEPVVSFVEEPVVSIVEEPVSFAAIAAIAAIEEPVALEQQTQSIIFEISPTQEVTIIPKLVFIIPYRERESQLDYFKKQMAIVLEDMPSTDYKILFIHQQDNRTFNRGAMKNIGFLYIKELYPDSYKTITLVFNDIDTMPYSKNFLNYPTIQGNIKHFYGYKFTLGGIVSITGRDFEITNGFPNFWAWGYEDNAFQQRVLRTGLNIDRSQFYPILDKNIMQFNDTLDRIMNRKEFDRYVDEHKYAQINDGYKTIHNLEYTIDGNFINVSNFKTAVDEQPQYNQIHNLKNGSTPFNVIGRRGRARMGMFI